MNLLWADDDSVGALDPLGRLLVRKGKFNLAKATTYSEAIDRLAASDPTDRIKALLVDIILPHGHGSSLSPDLGIELAKKAAENGVHTIAFLTVVPLDEVKDRYDHLKTNYPTVAWSYFDKISVLEELDNLIARLGATEE